MKLFDFGLRAIEEYSPKWNLNDKDVGVVTAADHIVFPGLQALFFSLKDKINFICYDIGLTQEQVKWCTKNNLIIKSLKFPDFILKDKYWQFYTKPWAIDQSPFNYTIWIDTDCIVSDLSKAELIISKQTFFVEYFLRGVMQKKTKDLLYTKYPVEVNHKEQENINTGVFAFNKNDENYFLCKLWKETMKEFFQDEIIKNCLYCEDEGALNWVIQKQNKSSIVSKDLRYNYLGSTNYPNRFDHLIMKKEPFFLQTSFKISKTFKEMFEKIEDIYVLHFSTGSSYMSRKYWNLWT
jgi:hypothetical protein